MFNSFVTSYYLVTCTYSFLHRQGAAGGGVVQFGLGRYYLQAPFALPNNVRLVGAGMGKTALYFSANNKHDAPMNFFYNDAPAKVMALALSY
jgi:hypothetical protein